MSLPLGKIPMRVLRRILKHVVCGEDILVGPGIGIDAAVIRSSSSIIVSACDPITGASRDVGWLSVHVNANDIAVCAAYPRWYVVVLLMPPGTQEEHIYELMSGIRGALSEIGASLVAGHTEITNKVTDTIVVGTMIGTPMISGKYVSNRNARPGDLIIMTKGAGIEGTWILVDMFRRKLGLSESYARRARGLRRLISVLPDVEALINIGIENIHAMHDATEGGLIGALFELAEASNVGFYVDEECVIIRDETRVLAEKLSLDPLKLISSGTLIAIVDPQHGDEAIDALSRRGIEASIIGRITSGKRVLRRIDGTEVKIRDAPVDELWRILGEAK